jgi:hypothetical protein
MLGITRAGISIGPGAHTRARPRISDLEATGRELADIAETPMAILVRHQAAPFRRTAMSSDVNRQA